MAVEFKVMDIGGILMHHNKPVIDFSIAGTTLVKSIDLTNGTFEYYPVELCYFGVNYGAFNEFFNQRVVRNHTQDLRMWLDQLGLCHYNPNEMIKKMNGWDGLGGYWIKFDNLGAKCWGEIVSQKYPIY